jgi:ABC-type transporter Mla MlaB component
MKYALNGELTIANAAKIKTELLQALSADGPFELDTTGVVEVDAAGLQLLLSAVKNAASRGAATVFPPEARGDAVGGALGLMGLGSRDWNNEDSRHG